MKRNLIKICFVSIFLVNTGVVFSAQNMSQESYTTRVNRNSELSDEVRLANIMDQAEVNLEGNSPSVNFRELITPIYKFNLELMGETNQIQMSSFGGKVIIPTYPVFGPPPPMIGLGYSYMNLDAPALLDLPSDLHELTVDASWIRSINEDWKLRMTLGSGFNTDGQNRSSDAWNFRGGLFGMYQTTPEWNWLFGVIALGRNDLPVLPAVGVIYQPNPEFRLDLTMPKPRVSFLMADNGPRQQWGYLGAGINGGTWAYERKDGTQDQLTYGDWRIVMGWESVPRKKIGIPFATGRKISAEIGYVFSREIEFEKNVSNIPLDGTWMFRLMLTL